MNQPQGDPARKYIEIEATDPRLHIMISSTTVDLPEHRQEASDAFQRLGHTQVMMELGSAEWNSDAIKFSLDEGIGGLGKSAVTWEWMQSRAPAAIPNLAGRVWWSFYEKGTSMVTFVSHALAYVTRQDPESLSKESSHYQRGQQLLTELRRRPFLLVLDGFERVLTAYHRLDKAQIPDDQVNSDLCECINPADGELLTQLLGCGPSKILISTRPAALKSIGALWEPESWTKPRVSIAGN